MRLNDVPPGVRVFGGDARGKVPTEAMEQVTFFNHLRSVFPDTLGRIAIHPRNEQMLRGGQHRALIRHKAEGMTPGAADIIIPARVPFVCELKRADRTKSKWQPGQREYLEAAAGAGAFACVAFGSSAAWDALTEWKLRYVDG